MAAALVNTMPFMLREIDEASLVVNSSCVFVAPARSSRAFEVSVSDLAAQS